MKTAASSLPADLTFRTAKDGIPICPRPGQLHFSIFSEEIRFRPVSHDTADSRGGRRNPTGEGHLPSNLRNSSPIVPRIIHAPGSAAAAVYPRSPAKASVRITTPARESKMANTSRPCNCEHAHETHRYPHGNLSSVQYHPSECQSYATRTTPSGGQARTRSTPPSTSWWTSSPEKLQA